MDQALVPPPRPADAAGALLDVDFDASRPYVVTAILAAHLPHTGEDTLWELTVGARIRTLLAILEREGDRPLWARQDCPNEACSEPIEIDLSPSELVVLAGDGDEVHVEHEGTMREVRRPTGRDQLAWQSRPFADEGDATSAVVADLVDGGPVDDTLAAAVEEALTERDPLVCLELAIACPYCREVRTVDVDVLDLVLGRFRERCEALVREVHTLALHYHWTEDEIAAVPAARRARYLALVDSGSR